MVNRWNDNVTVEDAKFAERVAPAVAPEAWRAARSPDGAAKRLSPKLRKVLRRSRNLASARNSRVKTKALVLGMEVAIAQLTHRCSDLEAKLRAAEATVAELTQVALSSGVFC